MSKKVKIVLDKKKESCYYMQVACEGGEQENIEKKFEKT